jgi:energy-coupling factor transporter transmembrane protein EcfT
VNILPEYSADLKGKYIEIDAGIKAILAILLGVASLYCNNWLDMVYFAVFLVVVTVFLRSNIRFILKNIAAYGIIFAFPCLCGLLLSLLFNKLSPGSAFHSNIVFEDLLLRMVKIFFIWYIGSLYFFTTPFSSIMDMLNKIFSPLNSLGIPVSKYLKIIMCIVNVLTKSVDQFKQDILEDARHVFKDNHLGVKSKLKELSSILVDFIANSLQQTDEIQKQVELTCIDNSQYTFRITKNAIVACFGCTIFLLLFFA